MRGLWDFAVDLYGAPGVAEACLTLQDRHGCDVNLILFAAFMGAERLERLSPADMAEANATVQSWRTEIVQPLRALRRRLKTGPPPAPREFTDELRSRIKAAELEAERIELLQLEVFAGNRNPSSGDALDLSLENLKVAARLFNGGELDADAALLVERIQSALAVKSAGSRG